MIKLLLSIQRALCAFQGVSEEELSFAENTKIVVLQKGDGGWWEGQTGDAIGWFPSDYVARDVVIAPPTEVLPETTADPALFVCTMT